MIIKKNKLNLTHDDYLEKQKEGLQKAIDNFDKRYQNKEIDRDEFLKGLKSFAKRQEDLIKKNNK